MLKDIIEKIFESGANALYHTIDSNTGECNDKVKYEKLKQDQVDLYLMRGHAITDKEMALIVWSLNQTYNDADKKLQGYNLGDLERGAIELTKTESKELLMKLSK